MHHQVAVRIGHRIEHLQEQPHAFAQVEIAGIAPVVDAFAVDPLHHEVGRSAGIHAAVQQLGDAGVAQAGEDLALAQEAVARQRVVQPDADALQRRLLGELAVVAFDRIHRAHAAAAEHAGDAPVTDPAADQRVGRFVDRPRFERPGRQLQPDIISGVAGVSGEHRLDIGPQGRIAAALPPQPDRALGLGLLQRRIEQAQGLAQVVVCRHGASPEPGIVRAFGAGCKHRCRVWAPNSE